MSAKVILEDIAVSKHIASVDRNILNNKTNSEGDILADNECTNSENKLFTGIPAKKMSKCSSNNNKSPLSSKSIDKDVDFNSDSTIDLQGILLSRKLLKKQHSSRTNKQKKMNESLPSSDDSSGSSMTSQSPFPRGTKRKLFDPDKDLLLSDKEQTDCSTVLSLFDENTESRKQSSLACNEISSSRCEQAETCQSFIRRNANRPSARGGRTNARMIRYDYRRKADCSAMVCTRFFVIFILHGHVGVFVFFCLHV